MNEFEMIQTYFLPLTMGKEDAVALSDDAAIIDVPDGHDLVVSSDTLNAGTHFLKGEEPANIAHKVLRVNLSDMAAMGAKPYCYQLNMAFQNLPDEAWVKAFTDALRKDNEAFGVFCSGGDTTITEGPTLISMTIMGIVPKGQAVKRSGARDGDLVVVSGHIGDAAVGVKILLDALKVNDVNGFMEALHMPEPRISISDEIAKYAKAAVDISDGLVADLGHICSGSDLAARVNLKDVPFSKDALALIGKGITHETLLTGGDDYEIAMAVAPEDFEAFKAAAADKGVELSAVGVFEAGSGVHVYDDQNEELEFKRAGWTHF